MSIFRGLKRRPASDVIPPRRTALRIFIDAIKPFWTKLVSKRPPPPQSAGARRRAFIEQGKQKKLAITGGPSVIRLPAHPYQGTALGEKPSIVILLFAHLGDFLVSLRALQIIREGFPGSRITLVSASWNLDWAEKIGFFERIVSFDFFSRLNRDWNGPAQDIFDRFASLSLGAYDIAIDLRHDADTRPCLYRVSARFRAGFEAPIEEGMPHLDLMLPSVENLQLSDGGEYSLHAELRMELLANAVVSAYATRPRPNLVSRLLPAEDLSVSRRYALLSLSAGDAIRYWPVADFAQVGDALIDRYGLDIVIVGGTAEEDYIDKLKSALPGASVKTVVDMPLIELPALIAGSCVYIGLGTGLTHLSAMLGVPTVAILSGVSPLAVWRPLGPNTITLTGLTPCSPCGLREEAQCPFGVTCLRAISSMSVIGAVDELIGETSGLSTERRGNDRRESL